MYEFDKAPNGYWFVTLNGEVISDSSHDEDEAQDYINWHAGYVANLPAATDTTKEGTA